MKRAFAIFLIILSAAFAARAQRPTVAVVLSGGGAKGASHVGVLKVLEEYEIPIDIITGTSMGALVGGLYAVGHSAAELDSIITCQDWDYLISGAVRREEVNFQQKADQTRYQIQIPFGIDWQAALQRKGRGAGSDGEDATDDGRQPSATDLFRLAPEGGASGILPMGLMAGQKIYALLTDCTVGYHNECDFKDLPIPYACIATDVASGKEVVFNKGILPMAMRASMAIPGVFPPVKTEDMVLVDGGMKNNFPVDVARAMGADYVIGVQIPSSNENADMNKVSGLLGKLFTTTVNAKTEEAMANTDILIQPDIEGYGTMSFNLESLRRLIDNGERAAREAEPELLELKRVLEQKEREHEERFVGPMPAVKESPKAVKLNDTIVLSSIRFVGISEKEEKLLRRNFSLETGKKISISDIERAVNGLYATKAYNSVVYTLGGDHSPFDLTMTMVPNRNNRLGIGIRFDTEEVSTILLDVGFNNYKLYGHRFGISARLANNYRFGVRYSYLAKNYTEWAVSNQLSRYNMPIYSIEQGTISPLAYLQNDFEVAVATGHLKRMYLKGGVRTSAYDYRTSLDIPAMPHAYSNDAARVAFMGPFLNLVVDNLDNVWFPTRGVKIEAGMQYLRDLSSAGQHSPLLDAKLAAKIVLPAGDRLAFTPFLNSRAVVGNDAPLVMMNCIGGTQAGRYSQSQIPFYGSTGVMAAEPLVAVAGLDVRYNVYKSHYLMLTGNYGRQGDSLTDFVSGSGFAGFRLGYAFDFVAGPVEVDLNWNSIHRSAGLYLSFGFWF